MSTIENAKAAATDWAPSDVTISANLFWSTISLLNEVDIEDYPTETIQLYGYILHSFNKIKSYIDFKEAFTRFFYTDDGHSRFAMHMNSEFFDDDSLPF